MKTKLTKKLVTIMLTLALVFSVTPTMTYANTNANAGGHATASTQAIQVNCSRCGSQGQFVTSWTEYNYYYVRVWTTYHCKKCNIDWNTAIDIPNNVWYGMV